MSTVTNIPTSGTPAAGTQVENKAASNLGKDDFLKLFVAQLQHQDPMNPTDNNEFMGQMAQYSALEQMTNVAKSSETISANTGMSQALGLLGKTVTYIDKDGGSHTGAVDKVITADGAAKLTIGGVDGIDPGAVSEVTSSPTT
jgi:flagellar basal-body rod modification protein FlgD